MFVFVFVIRSPRAVLGQLIKCLKDIQLVSDKGYLQSCLGTAKNARIRVSEKKTLENLRYIQISTSFLITHCSS